MLLFLNSNKNFFTFLFFLIFFLIGIFIFPDYGISIDEDETRIYGFISLKTVYEIFSPEYITNINEVIAEHKYELPNFDVVIPTSGIIFDLPMAFLELIYQIEDSRQYYLLRHLFTFLFFFISVYFFHQLVRKRYNSWLIGILGTLFLIISPKIFANSFYNNKDIIFMSLSIINLYIAINFLEKQNYKNAVIFAIVSALAINVRILGLILPTLVLLIYIINILRDESNKKKILQPLILFLILLPFFIFLFWPYLWSNPLENLLYSFKYLSDHTLTNHTFYLGHYIFSKDPPWHYHLVWILVSTPTLYLALFIIGFIFIAQRIIKRLLKIEKNDSYIDLWRGNKELQDLIFFLTFLIPLIVAIDFRSISYDGWRHLFFIYPSFLLIALLGLHLIKIIFFKRKNNFLYALTLFLIIPTIFWMYKNHPHQNIYFNFLAGKEFNKKFDMDYWGLSNKTALEYIVANETGDVKIANIGTSDLYAGLCILKNETVQKISIVEDIENADYIINSKRDWTGRTKIYDYKTPANFKFFHQMVGIFGAFSLFKF